MTDQLETLIRDTLAGRAATVSEAPSLDVATPRRRRSVWPAAAAAVTVVGLAGGLAAVRGGSDPAVVAGGHVAPACVAPLPAAWQRAAHRLSPETGQLTNVRAVTPDGAGIGEAVDPHPGYERIVLVPLHGAQRLLWRVRTDGALAVDTDGTSAVVAIAPTTTAYVPRPAVDDVAVIDLRTRRIRHILAQAPIPSDWIVTWSSTVIDHGVVYLLARPRQATATTGAVVSYSVRTGRYAVLSRTAAVDADPDPFDHQQLVRDVRGVAWRGGSVADPAAPAGLPAFFTSNGTGGRYQPVRSDGRDTAWQDRADPSLVHWTAGNGASRTVDVGHALDHFSTPTVAAVAGPFVFLEASAREFVLDTRDAAVARFDVASHVALSDRGALQQTTQATGLLLGTSELPGLTCPTH